MPEHQTVPPFDGFDDVRSALEAASAAKAEMARNREAASAAERAIAARVRAAHAPRAGDIPAPPPATPPAGPQADRIYAAEGQASTMLVVADDGKKGSLEIGAETLRALNETAGRRRFQLEQAVAFLRQAAEVYAQKHVLPALAAEGVFLVTLDEDYEPRVIQLEPALAEAVRCTGGRRFSLYALRACFASVRPEMVAAVNGLVALHGINALILDWSAAEAPPAGPACPAVAAGGDKGALVEPDGEGEDDD
jgi:hypothetical protein